MNQMQVGDDFNEENGYFLELDTAGRFKGPSGRDEVRKEPLLI